MKNSFIIDSFEEISPRFYRMGLAIMVLIVALLVTVFFLVDFKQTVNGDIVILSKNRHEELKAGRDGKVTAIYAGNNEWVKSGQRVATINAPFDESELLRLQSSLQGVKNRTLTFLSGDRERSLALLESIDIEEVMRGAALIGVNTGGLASLYFQLKESLSPEANSELLTLLDQALDNNKSLLEEQKRKDSLLKESFKLASRQYEMKESLYKAGAISKNEFLKDKMQFNQSKERLIDSSQQLLNYMNSSNALEKEKRGLLSSQKLEERELINRFLAELKGLLDELERWQKEHVIYAGIEGTLNFIEYKGINQQIEIGETLFAVIPSEAQVWMGKIVLPINSAEQINEGDRVMIGFPRYPPLRYGHIEGRVSSKSKVYNQGNYTIFVELDRGLTTSSGYRIDYEREMVGRARIITKEEKIIEKLFKKIDSRWGEEEK